MVIANHNNKLLSDVQLCESENSPEYNDNALQHDEEFEIDDGNESFFNYLDSPDAVLNTIVEAKDGDGNIISPDRRARQFIESIKQIIGEMSEEEPVLMEPQISLDDDDKSFLKYLDSPDVALNTNTLVKAKDVDGNNISADRRVRQFIESIKRVIEGMGKPTSEEIDCSPNVQTPHMTPLHARSKIPVTQKRPSNKHNVPVATVKRTITKTSLTKPTSVIAFGRRITIRKTPQVPEPGVNSLLTLRTPSTLPLHAGSKIPVSQKRIAQHNKIPPKVATIKRNAPVATTKRNAPVATLKRTITKTDLIKPSTGLAFGRRITVTPAVKKAPSIPTTNARRTVPVKPAKRKTVAEQMVDYQNSLTASKLEEIIWRYIAGTGQDVPKNYKVLLLERMRRILGKRYYPAGEDVTEEVPAVKQIPSIGSQSVQKIGKLSRVSFKSSAPAIPTFKRNITKPIDNGKLGICFGRRLVTPAARKTPVLSVVDETPEDDNKIAKLMVDFQKKLTPSKLERKLWEFDPNSKKDIPEDFILHLLERMRRTIGKRYYPAGDEISEDVPINQPTTIKPYKSTIKSSRVLLPKGVAFGRKISFTPQQTPGGASKRPVPGKTPKRLTVAEKMVEFLNSLTYHKLREKKWTYDNKKDLPKNYKDLLLERMRRAIGKRYYPDGEEITVDVPAVKESEATEKLEKSATKVAFGRSIPADSTVKKSAIKPPGIAFGRRITKPAVREKRIPKVPTPKLTVAEKMQAYQNSLTQEKLKEKLWYYTGDPKEVPKNYKNLLLERMRRNLGKRYYPAGEEITNVEPGVADVNESPKEVRQDAQNIVKSPKKMSVAKLMVAYQNAITPSKLAKELWHFDPNAKEDIPENFSLHLLHRMRRIIGKRYYSAGDEITEDVPDGEESSSEEALNPQNVNVPQTVRVRSTIKRAIVNPSAVKSSSGIAFGRRILATPAVKKIPRVTAALRTVPAKPAKRKTVAEQMVEYQNTLTATKLEEETWRYTAGTGQAVPKNYKNLLLERMRRGLGKRFYPAGEDITDEVPGMIECQRDGLQATENINATPNIAQTVSPLDENLPTPQLVVPSGVASASGTASKQKPIGTSRRTPATGSSTGTTQKRKPHLVVPNSSIVIPKKFTTDARAPVAAVPKQTSRLLPPNIHVPVVVTKKIPPVAGTSTGVVPKRLPQVLVPKTSCPVKIPKKTSPVVGSSKQTSSLLPPKISVSVAVSKKISLVAGPSNGAVPKRLPQILVQKATTHVEIPKKTSTGAVLKKGSSLLRPKIGISVAASKKISVVAGSSTGTVPKRSPLHLVPNKTTHVEISQKSSTAAVLKSPSNLLPPKIGISVAVSKKISVVAGSSTGAVSKRLPQLLVPKDSGHVKITKKTSPAVSAVPKQPSCLLPPNICGSVAASKKISPVAGASTGAVLKRPPQLLVPKDSDHVKTAKKTSPAAGAVPKQLSRLAPPNICGPVAASKKISPVAGPSTGAVLKRPPQLLVPKDSGHVKITKKTSPAAGTVPKQPSRLAPPNICGTIAASKKISPVARPSTGAVLRRPPQLLVPNDSGHVKIARKTSAASAVPKQPSRHVSPNICVPVAASKKISPVASASTGAVLKRPPQLLVPKDNGHVKIAKKSSPAAGAVPKQPSRLVPPNICGPVAASKQISPVARPSTGAVPKRPPQLLVPNDSGHVKIAKKSSPAAGAVPKQPSRHVSPNIGGPVAASKKISPVAGPSTGAVLKRPPQLLVPKDSGHIKIAKKTSPAAGAVPKQPSRLVPPNICGSVAASKKISPIAGPSTGAVPKRPPQLLVPKDSGQVKIPKKTSPAAITSKTSSLLPPKISVSVEVSKKISVVAGPSTGAVLKRLSQLPVLKNIDHSEVSGSTSAVPKQTSRLLPPNIGVPVAVLKKISPVGVSKAAEEKQNTRISMLTKTSSVTISKMNSSNAIPKQTAQHVSPAKTSPGRVLKTASFNDKQTIAIPKTANYKDKWKQAQAEIIRRGNLPREQTTKENQFTSRDRDYKKQNTVPIPVNQVSREVPKSIVRERSPKLPVSPEESALNLTLVSLEDLELDLSSPSAELLMLGGESLITKFRHNLENTLKNNEPPDKPYKDRRKHKKTKSNPKLDLFEEEGECIREA